MKLPANFDRTNALVAFGVFLVSLIVYIRTQAPTLSFWDCGEFIATSYILGIPHPPGTPTYVLFGRIASIIPTFTDICARVNFLSGFCSSLAAMFGYLFGVRVMRYWFDAEKSGYSRFLIYAGAASGALLMAFGRTQWNNSVEAEVYGMSMMLTFAITWLTAIYFENRGTRFGHRIMLLIVYLAFLGIGVHMATFLVMPASLLFFILRKETPTRYWFLLAGFVIIELYLIFALSSRPDEIPFFIPVLIAFFFYLCYMLSYERIGWQLLTVGGGFLIAGLPGILAVVGISREVWTAIGALGYMALIVFGVYLMMQYLKDREAEDATSKLTAGLFVVVSALMTGLVQIGLENGEFGYKLFLALSVLLVISLGLVLWRYVRLTILIALAGPAMIILGVKQFFWGTAIAVAVVLALGLIWRFRGWRLALVVIAMTVAGYSTHVFAPIRSSLDPYINENSPGDSLEATINFFERKQYGSQSMTERMFKRRAEWINQFGNHARMGFWGFFNEQYGITGKSFVLLLLLGIFGAWEASRRRPELGLYLVVLLLVTSVGLILYMNFADGTRQTAVDAWLEVRDRDYFFTPGFMYFGLSIGLGLTALAQLLRETARKSGPAVRGVALGVAPVIFLLPVMTVAQNYYVCDRSQNYIPYDYANNIMQSAEPNGIVFTFGDNDTFPLWCLQEVYGVRRDLKLICCALSNGDWYVKQIKDYMGLDMGWTDQEIEELRPFRTPDGRTFRVQDQVVDAVVAHNIDKYPIYYSLLAHRGARTLFGRNVDTLMELSGLCFRLTDSASAEGLRVDVDHNIDLMIDSGAMVFRDWTNPGIFHSETTERSLRGVAEHFMMVGDAALRDERNEEGVRVLRYLTDSVYYSRESVIVLAEVLGDLGDTAALRRVAEEYPVLDEQRAELIMARAYLRSGERQQAMLILQELLTEDPGCRECLNEVMQIYISERDVPAMIRTLETWLYYNPGDAEIREALSELNRQLEEAGEGAETTP